MSEPFRIEQVNDVAADDSDVARLFLELWSELDEIYGPNPGTEFHPRDMDRVGHVVFVAYSQEQAIGCVAIAPWHRQATFELKRMYVSPVARGTAVADRLLGAAESEARARLGTGMRLETGTSQPRAIAFYQRNGYRPCACWGSYADDPTSRCFVKAIA